MKRYRILFLIIAWMCLIFLFSAQDGAASSSLSQFVSKLFPFWPKDDSGGTGLLFGFLPLRKLAHITEYAVLGILFCRYFKTYSLSVKKIWGYAFLCTIFYAATDEFHQLFVPGRAGSLLDVGIDGIGAAAGIFLSEIVSRMRKKKM